jgi:hypothetical protein
VVLVIALGHETGLSLSELPPSVFCAAYCPATVVVVDAAAAGAGGEFSTAPTCDDGEDWGSDCAVGAAPATVDDLAMTVGPKKAGIEDSVVRGGVRSWPLLGGPVPPLGHCA